MRKVILIFVLLFKVKMFAAMYNVTDFGAVADGVTLDTKAVQKTIDACYNAGGGTVVIPSGKTVVIGTIYLKDYVNLKIENGAVLLGSPDYKDYTTDTHKNTYKNETHMDRCLIFAKETKHFSITGNGTIDGNGYFKNFTKKKGGRPMLLRFLNCSDIKVKDVNLINPAAWTSAWLYCNEIVVDGIKIISRVEPKNNNGCTKTKNNIKSTIG